MSSTDALHSYLSKILTYFLLSYLFLLLSSPTSAEECVYSNDCQCVFHNGSVVDVSSLASKKGPRFEQKPANQTYTYYFNFCNHFSMGPAGSACQDVAVCQKSPNNEYFNCGDQVRYFYNNAKQSLHMIYMSRGSVGELMRQTNVTLVCNPVMTDPQLIVKGETKPGSGLYEMELHSRCACADLCRQDHLSAGSVLVIIFLIFVSLYLVLGIIHSSLTRGAAGWELIPHYDFWVDFPLLVRDGCVFVMNGFKVDTSYEQI